MEEHDRDHRHRTQTFYVGPKPSITCKGARVVLRGQGRLIGHERGRTMYPLNAAQRTPVRCNE